MTLLGDVLSRRWGLPRAQTQDVVCERDLRVEMDDGAVLLADRWVARAARDTPQPTVLVRSCYGRRGFFGLLHGRLLAERGLQAVVQSVRGTYGSEGSFNPFEERADGLATLRWLDAQPWHTGRVGMTGLSYLGLVQWALASDAGDDLGALSVQGSASQFHGQSFAGGSMSLETSLQWLAMIALQERRPAPLPMARGLLRLHRMLMQAALDDLDVRATGAQVAWFREAVSKRERSDPYWATRDFSAGVTSVTAPVQMITGWYDAFTPWQLEDFLALQEADRPRQLIIGPWTHTAEDLTGAGVREGLGWLRAHLLGDDRLIDPAPVRLLTTGERPHWRSFDRWPPAGGRERRLWPDAGGRLGWEPAVGDGGEGYRYEPTDPTPSIGGPVMLSQRPVRDNRAHEARADVITFTTEPLTEAVEAIGSPTVELWARASEPYFDLFARVCDVTADGASLNVCDALASVAPGRFERSDEDDAWRVAFVLWPLAHRFAAGHRIRLQISSGAHPRYVRNPGTGADPLTAPQLRAVDVQLLYGPAHPSALVLGLVEVDEASPPVSRGLRHHRERLRPAAGSASAAAATRAAPAPGQ